MNKRQCVSLTLLASLLLFVLAIPFGNAIMVSEGEYNLGQGAVNLGQGPFYYNANPITVNFDSYTGGFLYNTVTELRAAYDLNTLYAKGYDGSGQAVVIVDAFGSPTIYSDLLSFIQWQNTYAGANLPWTTMSEIQRHLTIYYPEGYVFFNATNSDELGWSVEVTLDVDMVHSIAPGANIALVISSSDNDVPLNYAVLWAVNHHLGSVISQSWGDPEWDIAASGRSGYFYLMQAHQTYQFAASMGITVFASAGDSGAEEGGTYNSPNYPASDPYVTAVGGTNLFMNCPDGYSEGTGNWTGQTWPGLTYKYEIAGNDYEAMAADGYPSPFDLVTTGGAMSQFFSLPYWQQGITMTYANGKAFTPAMRCVSDVSFDSGVYGGLGAVPWSTATPGSPIYYIVGGTSAGSPFWAALTAIADQYLGHSLGYINPLLYANRATFYGKGAFHDVAKGDNTYPTGNPVIGYEATKGWDAPTGVGSPDAAILVPQLKLFAYSF